MLKVRWYLKPLPYSMPYNHSTTFEGDAAACAEWLNFARGHLRIMLNLKVANNFQTFFPAPEVEVQIWTKPNRIYVKAGNELAIAYSDVTQAIDARTVFSTDTRLNVPPTTPSVTIPTFGEANHLIGDRYWASEKTPEAVSWQLYGNYLYYRGVRIAMPFSGGVWAAAVASSSGGEVKFWAMDVATLNIPSKLYLLTVQKVSGVWTVTSTQTGIIPFLINPGTGDLTTYSVNTPLFSRDGKTLLFFAGIDFPAAVYKLRISSNSASPDYPFNGANNPTLMDSGPGIYRFVASPRTYGAVLYGFAYFSLSSDERPVYSITVDVLTGKWTKTYFSSGYITPYRGHNEIPYTVYFSDAYYGLTITRLILLEFTGPGTNKIRICNKGVNTDILSQTFPGNIGSPMWTEDKNYAMTKKQLVVCISDPIPDSKTGAGMWVRKTLIFSLDKTARTATLKKTLDYDIRMYPSTLLGRIAVTKYPKLK